MKFMALQRLSVSFMQQTGPGEFMPDFVEISLLDDGKEFRKVKTINNDIPWTQLSPTLKIFYSIFWVKKGDLSV